VSEAEEAVAAIRARRPIVLPMDTVYGLCASLEEGAVRALYALKGRASRQPTAIVAADLRRLVELVPGLRGGPAEALARALLPGAYTLVLPNPDGVFPWLAGGRDTIGVRVPDVSGVTAAVLREVGALTATSANLPGGADPVALADVPERIRAGCGALVDGGRLPGVPSTVVDLTGAKPRILREGAVPAAEALERISAATARQE
jgi:L-threonylcarbamoyladenylate synthase